MRPMLAAFTLALSACDGAGAEEAENCVSEWACIDGLCECSDGTVCDDAEDCDVACEVCQ